MTDRQAKRKTSNAGLTAAVCAVFVAGMVGMSFAAVPLYRIFCQVTGFGGTTQRADTAPEAPIERTIRVRFDSNIGNGLGWSFRPLVREVKLQVGEIAEVAFLAENRTDRRTTGTATFNVTPLDAGAYFNKMSCFCFTSQALDAGEKAEMPVVFFVDPSIVEDRNMDAVDTITLSYTFYPAGPEAETKPVAAVEAETADGAL